MLLHKPTNPLLSPLVNCIWYVSGGRSTRELALPTGTTELVINLRSAPMRIFSDVDDFRGQSFPRSVICGTHSRYFVLGSSPDDTVIGVHFLPGGAMPFLRLPLSEVADAHVSLEDIWGISRTEVLRDWLASLPPADAVRALEGVLLAMLEEGYSHHPAVQLALREFNREPALARIQHVSKATRYSEKRFIQLFTETIGVGPKRFCRVVRLQSVLIELAKGEKVNWAGFAASSGYYDQSHLIRDFRMMTGLTPSQYRPVDPESPYHMAV